MKRYLEVGEKQGAILIVDDSRLPRAISHDMSAEAGFEVVMAASALEANA